MSEPVVSFIIPVRNDPMRLSMCLEAIKANELAGKSYEIVVCDNGSVDQTPDVARDAGARVLDLPDIKVSELRNRGAQQAHGSILAFIDADNLIVDDWLKCVMETLEHHPKQALRAANTNARTQARGSSAALTPSGTAKTESALPGGFPQGILPCGGTPSKPSTASTPPWRPARTWTFAVASKRAAARS